MAEPYTQSWRQLPKIFEGNDGLRLRVLVEHAGITQAGSAHSPITFVKVSILPREGEASYPFALRIGESKTYTELQECSMAVANKVISKEGIIIAEMSTLHKMPGLHNTYDLMKAVSAKLAGKELSLPATTFQKIKDYVAEQTLEAKCLEAQAVSKRIGGQPIGKAIGMS